MATPHPRPHLNLSTRRTRVSSWMAHGFSAAPPGRSPGRESTGRRDCGPGRSRMAYNQAGDYLMREVPPGDRASKRARMDDRDRLRLLKFPTSWPSATPPESEVPGCATTPSGTSSPSRTPPGQPSPGRPTRARGDDRGRCRSPRRQTGLGDDLLERRAGTRPRDRAPHRSPRRWHHGDRRRGQSRGGIRAVGLRRGVPRRPLGLRPADARGGRLARERLLGLGRAGPWPTTWFARGR